MKIQNLLKSGIIAGLIATALNVTLYLISKSFDLINDAILLPDGSSLQLLPVVISSLVPGIVAALVLWGMAKVLKNAVTVFTIAGVLFLFVSLMGPLSIPSAPVGFKVVLSLMHFIAGGSIIYFLRKTSLSYKNETSK